MDAVRRFLLLDLVEQMFRVPHLSLVKMSFTKFLYTNICFGNNEFLDAAIRAISNATDKAGKEK